MAIDLGALYAPGIPVVLLVAFAAYTIYAYFSDGLSHIPGPAIARISNLWKINAAFHAEMPWRNIALHRKYGPLVRIGHNMVSVNDPEAYPVINGFKRVFRKTKFYSTAEAWYKGKPLPTIITARDRQYHSQLLRVAGGAYSIASGPQMEAKMQPLVDLLLSKMNEFGQSGKRPVNVARLLAHFAFDAMGIINVSEPFGFLEKDVDVQGAIQAIDLANTYFSVIAQAPWMHTFLLGNRFAQSVMEKQNPVLNLALAMVDKRLAAVANADEEKKPDKGGDFLGRLLELNESAEVSKAGNKLRYEQIVSLVLANTMAGYATVAIALRSILYLLARHRDVYARLQRELDEAFASGALSQPPNHTVAEASKLPYLDAVIVEALRVHPVLGLILEREVPEGGAVLAGQHVPEGTIVGFNPWVILHNTQVYGEDADVFRPERWLEADETRLREMKRCNITFGAGPRTCQGKNIGMMEILKLMPALMHRFDFALANPGEEWQVTGHWFTMQSKMDMIFTPRRQQ
ncbi:cytochrome P450 [Achaetomium macrosporum]|uniref:Cytochrome P450 n=1 Tax=Achaetomium macrosporum TaxID=79813 RepID=A0AAN7HE83_9PEZI|nr:cytochrome P450 [Achaetomium macrosporum]